MNPITKWKVNGIWVLAISESHFACEWSMRQLSYWVLNDDCGCEQLSKKIHKQFLKPKDETWDAYKVSEAKLSPKI